MNDSLTFKQQKNISLQHLASFFIHTHTENDGQTTANAICKEIYV